MNKEFELAFLIDGVVCGSTFLQIDKDGKFNTSIAEEAFYKMLRNNEDSLRKEAAEEVKEKIIDGLTTEQEELLSEEHAKNYHGLDDDMPDDFENWLMDLDYDELVKILKL